MNYSKTLSSKRIAWIREQGYTGFSIPSIQAFAFGNRFAYRLSLFLLTPAVLLANVPLLLFMNVIVFSNLFLPNHPFDYIYNSIVRKWTGGPELPPRSRQFVFASMMASMVIASTIFFISAGMMTAAYIMGGQLIIGLSLVSFIDYCFMAKIYNAIFSKKS